MNKFKKFEPSDYIKDENHAKDYLKIMLDENGVDGFLRGLGEVAKSRGMSKISKGTGLSRESLYKSLSPKGNPAFSTVVKTLDFLDMELSFTDKKTAIRK